MDALGLLLTATGVDRRLTRGSVTQDLISALIVGAVIVGCVIAMTVLLGAALTFAIADHVGDWLSATLIAAAVFAAAAAVLGLVLRWQLGKVGSDVAKPAPSVTAAASDPAQLFAVAESAGLTHPKSLWDIATLVALGFVSGLPSKAPPAH
jgi:hypothetical protein